MYSGSAIPSISRDEVYDLDILLSPLLELEYIRRASPDCRLMNALLQHLSLRPD